MFFTSDRYEAGGGRWLRQARRHADPMGEFLASVDVLIYVAGAAFAASVIAIVVG
jgi:hypothetical protein